MGKPFVQPALPIVTAQWAENVLAALRTAGALLAGNSLLIYFGIVGKEPADFYKVLLAGGFVFLVCSLPVALIQRNTFARKKLESETSKGD